jgi:SAM-dependent methyltransferase
VALYSLGSPTLLAEASDEVMALMTRFGLIGPDRDVLDLGCGIGRFLERLAPRVLSVLGVDISSGMVAEARRRCARLANVRVVQGNGRDLDDLGEAGFDGVLAVDVFPYLVQAGHDLAAAHIRAFGRMLRPGGAALILNYSYRGDLDRDRRDIETAAEQASLSVELAGAKPLRLWDGAVFLLRRPASSFEPVIVASRSGE